MLAGEKKLQGYIYFDPLKKSESITFNNEIIEHNF